MPSLRVDAALREAAESVLNEGESLSSFMEQSLRNEVQRRQLQRAFVAHGLAARDEARRTGEYFEVEVVHSELRRMLTDARARKARR